MVHGAMMQEVLAICKIMQEEIPSHTPSPRYRYIVQPLVLENVVLRPTNVKPLVY